MNAYEVTFLFSQNEESFKAGLQKVKDEFTKAGATITKEDDLGIRTTAYPVKKQTKAHYYYFEMTANPASILPMEKIFNISGDILKYLFVRKEN
ncbi:MAG: 30S ribosomal protein S6 [Spirochaetia bacterium]|nr:30S ribosomal protein S6 [Spirochaetia bacterium]